MEEIGMGMLELEEANRAMRAKYPKPILYAMVVLIIIAATVTNLVMLAVELVRE
jgi:hypothetical protein